MFFITLVQGILGKERQLLRRGFCSQETWKCLHTTDPSEIHKIYEDKISEKSCNIDVQLI